MAAQLAERPLHETGMQASSSCVGPVPAVRQQCISRSSPRPPLLPHAQVHASQLHAPGMVLLGDAAHAVSPATSNGMNGALEDAAVLAQAVQAVAGDLTVAPEAYTAARLADVQALLWLDAALSGVAGRGGGGGADGQPDPRATRAAAVARGVLGALTRGWVRPHALVRLKDGGLPYAEARRAVQRDAQLVGLLTAGARLGAVAAAGALLAIVVSAWR